MNQNGQMIVETIFVSSLVVVLILGTVSILHLQRSRLKHEEFNSDSSKYLELDMSRLYSMGLVTFDSPSTKKNVEALEKKDWTVDRKFKDPNGQVLVLMKKGNDGMIVNKNIGVKVCLENCI